MKNLRRILISIGVISILAFIFLMMTASDGWAAMAILYTFGPIALIAIIIGLISLVVSLAKKENKGILTKIFLWTISLVFLYFIYALYCSLT